MPHCGAVSARSVQWLLKQLNLAHKERFNNNSGNKLPAFSFEFLQELHQRVHALLLHGVCIVPPICA